VAEAQFRQLLDGAGLAPPDDVAYDPASLIFRWHAPKLAVVVDLDDQEPDGVAEHAVDMY
jgi:hypothetical protein